MGHESDWEIVQKRLRDAQLRFFVRLWMLWSFDRYERHDKKEMGMVERKAPKNENRVNTQLIIRYGQKSGGMVHC